MSARERRAAGMIVLGTLLGATATLQCYWYVISGYTAYNTEHSEEQIMDIVTIKENMIEFDEILNITTLENNDEKRMTARLLYTFHDVTESRLKILIKITRGTIEISTDEIPLGILMQNVKVISSPPKKSQQLIDCGRGKKR